MPKKDDDLVPIRSSEYQTFGDRLKHRRATMKPVMTQRQLADRAKVSMETIRKIEKNLPEGTNIKMATLKRLAHALDCVVFITIRPKSIPSRSTMEFRLEYPEGQPLPKRTHKASGAALAKALSNLRSYQKNYRRRPYHEQHTTTSGKRDLGIPELDTDGPPPKRRGKSSREWRTQQDQD